MSYVLHSFPHYLSLDDLTRLSLDSHINEQLRSWGTWMRMKKIAAISQSY